MSSSDRMKVDYDQLADLEQHLTQALEVIGREFEATASLALAAGDVALAGRITVFGNSWNAHRFDVRDRLAWLRDSVTNIQEQLSNTDAELARGLAPAPAPLAGLPTLPVAGQQRR